MARFVSTLLAAATLFIACSGEGPSDLQWDINFMCPSDADLTTQVHIRVLKGGCDGNESVYEAFLARGGEAPEDVISRGTYGLEVQALDADDAVVAQACNEQKLPAKRVAVVLASPTCALSDAGIPVEPEPGAPDGEVACPAGGCEEEPKCMIDDVGDCTCQSFNGHGYLFCPQTLSWERARRACRDKGLDLTIIDSAEENAFLAAQAGGKSRWMGANDRGNNGLGASLGPLCDETCRKPIGSQEGTWKWVNALSDNERGATFCELASSQDPTCVPDSGRYTNWAASEPNNTHASKCQYPGDSCDEGEDCGVITASGTWQDNACSASLPFVCETF